MKSIFKRISMFGRKAAPPPVKKKSARLTKRDKFNRAISFCMYFEEDEEILRTIVKTLAREHQSHKISRLILGEYNYFGGGNTESSTFDNLFFPLSKVVLEDGTLGEDLLYDNSSSNGVLNLKRDPVISSPWHIGRLIRSLDIIPSGKWAADIHNHRCEIYYPQRIGIVNSGTHSVSVGILNAEDASISGCREYDLSVLFPYVYTDGENYFTSHDNEPFHEVSNIEFAIIFEIGKLMKGIVPKAYEEPKDPSEDHPFTKELNRLSSSPRNKD